MVRYSSGFSVFGLVWFGMGNKGSKRGTDANADTGVGVDAGTRTGTRRGVDAEYEFDYDLFFDELPLEVRHLILSFLSPGDLCALASTSTSLRHLMADDYIWFNAYQDLFGGGHGLWPERMRDGARGPFRVKLERRVRLRGLFPVGALFGVVFATGDGDGECWLSRVGCEEAVERAVDVGVCLLGDESAGTDRNRKTLLSLTVVMASRGLGLAFFRALAEALGRGTDRVPEYRVVRALHFVFHVLTAPSVWAFLRTHVLPLIDRMRAERIAWVGTRNETEYLAAAKAVPRTGPALHDHLLPGVVEAALELGMALGAQGAFPDQVKAALFVLDDVHRSGVSDGDGGDGEGGDEDGEGGDGEEDGEEDGEGEEEGRIKYLNEYLFKIGMIPSVASFMVEEYGDEWAFCETTLLQSVFKVLFAGCLNRAEGLHELHIMHDRVEEIHSSLSQITYTLINQGQSVVEAWEGMEIRPFPRIEEGALTQALFHLADALPELLSAQQQRLSQEAAAAAAAVTDEAAAAATDEAAVTDDRVVEMLETVMWMMASDVDVINTVWSEGGDGGEGGSGEGGIAFPGQDAFPPSSLSIQRPWGEE